MKKLKALVKSRLKSTEPNFPVPDGYQTWTDYMKSNSKPPPPYKSWLEYRLGMGPLRGCEYEPYYHEYEQHTRRKYLPDFVGTGTIPAGDLCGDKLLRFLTIWYEAKGRFRTPAEANKYLAIREYLPDDVELIFIFSDKNVKFPGAKKRKNGTKMTQEEWCKKHDFLYKYESDL